MEYRICLTTRYNCSLERAFKTPMLCDVRGVHTGMGLMPPVTGVQDDADWGKPGSSKKVIMAKNFVHKGGYASMDHVVERIELSYWKIRVDHFAQPMLGFTEFIGEWTCSEEGNGAISVNYCYTLIAQNRILAPLQWLFVHLFWKRYMKQVLENIRVLIQNEAPYLYS